MTSVSTKAEIISLLSDVNRDGISNVIAYLTNSNYFTARCYHHHRYTGGLADHCLSVYHEMRAMAPELSDESCRIAALFHDLCTSHLEGYDEVSRRRHGQRSVDILDVLGLELHEEERIAIANHMHHVPSSELNETTKLWQVLHTCDSKNANENSI